MIIRKPCLFFSVVFLRQFVHLRVSEERLRSKKGKRNHLYPMIFKPNLKWKVSSPAPTPNPVKRIVSEKMDLCLGESVLVYHAL